MTCRLTARAFWLLVVLALCLTFPYAAKVQRYLGTVWVPVQLVGVFAAVLVGYRYVLPGFLRRVTGGTSLVLLGVTLVLLVAAFVVIYPRADYLMPRGGSDRDQALNAAVGGLLHGRYPYYPRTGRGTAADEEVPIGPISPLPGALLFAVPFALLGNVVYQNFFWLIVLFIVMTVHLKDVRQALLFFWMVLVVSPICLHEVVTGGDLLSNSLWVFVLTLLLVRCVSDPKTTLTVKSLVSVLFGIGLSSRVNFLVVGPLVFSALIQGAGWRSALTFMCVAALACLAVTLPFYFYDPPGFSPLHAFSKLDWFRSVLPGARLLVPMAGGVLAVVLSFQRMDEKRVVLCRNCAIALAWPVVCTVVLSSMEVGRVELHRFGWYSLSFMFFAAFACWIGLVKESAVAAPGGR